MDYEFYFSEPQKEILRGLVKKWEENARGETHFNRLLCQLFKDAPAFIRLEIEVEGERKCTAKIYSLEIESEKLKEFDQKELQKLRQWQDKEMFEQESIYLQFFLFIKDLEKNHLIYILKNSGSYGKKPPINMGPTPAKNAEEYAGYPISHEGFFIEHMFKYNQTILLPTPKLIGFVKNDFKSLATSRHEASLLQSSRQMWVAVCSSIAAAAIVAHCKPTNNTPAAQPATPNIQIPAEPSSQQH